MIGRPATDQATGQATGRPQEATRTVGDPAFALGSFLRAFRAHRAEALEPFLHADVTYAVAGFAGVEGRRAVLAYWRRMFESHAEVRMSASRRIQDGEVVIAAQRQAYASTARAPVVVDSLVVYELRDGRIFGWSDTLRALDLDPDERDLWRRLRRARW